MDPGSLKQTSEVIYSKVVNPISDIPLPGGYFFSPTYLQALAIIVLLFLLVFSFARIRHVYVDWSLKGVLPGVLFGALIVFSIEMLFLTGGKTLLARFLEWEHVPKPVAGLVNATKNGLNQVLGASSADESDKITIVKNNYSSLSEVEKDEIKLYICKQ